mgnify:CR=1 FL=1
MNRKGVEALFEAEESLARAEHDLDTTEAKAFLMATGSVAEKTAKAKLDAAQARLERDLARATVNRVRTKLRVIESEIMAQATMSKLMQAEMKL